MFFAKRDPLGKALIGLAIVATLSSLLYSGIWSLHWHRNTIEAVALSLGLLGALLLIHDLFVHTQAADRPDEPTYAMTAFLALSVGVAFLALLHWRPDKHSFLADVGLYMAAFSISICTLLGLFSVSPRARSLVENRTARVVLATALLIAAFLFQLRVALTS